MLNVRDVEHFKWQYKNPKIDEKSKDGNEAAGVVESDSEGEGAWAWRTVEDDVSIVSREIEDLDWWSLHHAAVVKLYDWFFEANESRMMN